MKFLLVKDEALVGIAGGANDGVYNDHVIVVPAGDPAPRLPAGFSLINPNAGDNAPNVYILGNPNA